jgi:hypothetical protein
MGRADAGLTKERFAVGEPRLDGRPRACSALLLRHGRAVCAHRYCSPEAIATIPDSRLCDRTICASATDQVFCRQRDFVSIDACRNAGIRIR